jgi:hypothetical protein
MASQRAMNSSNSVKEGLTAVPIYPRASEILFLGKFAEVTANAVNGYFSR